jgi:hypothetical protein
MRNISEKNCKVNKTHFFKQLRRLGDNVEKYFGAKQAKVDNMKHAYFMLDN